MPGQHPGEAVTAKPLWSGGAGPYEVLAAMKERGMFISAEDEVFFQTIKKKPRI